MSWWRRTRANPVAQLRNGSAPLPLTPEEGFVVAPAMLLLRELMKVTPPPAGVCEHDDAIGIVQAYLLGRAQGLGADGDYQAALDVATIRTDLDSLMLYRHPTIRVFRCFVLAPGSAGGFPWAVVVDRAVVVHCLSWSDAIVSADLYARTGRTW